MASSCGGWEGSEVTEYDLLRLRRARKIPPAVEVRIPGDEVVPAPQPGECAVFTSHFARGFGLPASTFLRSFLDYYHLQLHHLGANAIMLLAAFATFCEGYLGVRPSIGLWVRFFHFRAQMVNSGETRPNPRVGDKEPARVPVKVMVECGAASIYPNTKSEYPNPKPLQSVKKWQRTFFYVKTADGEPDALNLPPFRLEPPEERTNWTSKVGHGDTDLDDMVKRTKELCQSGLEAADLIATFIARRVLPLQRRPHRICDMGGHRDSTRTSTARLDRGVVRDRVRAITDLKLDAKWWFGLHAYHRDARPPQVLLLSLHVSFASCRSGAQIGHCYLIFCLLPA